MVSRPRRQRSAGSPSVTDRHDEATEFFDGLGGSRGDRAQRDWGYLVNGR